MNKKKFKELLSWFGFPVFFVAIIFGLLGFFFLVIPKCKDHAYNDCVAIDKQFHGGWGGSGTVIVFECPGAKNRVVMRGWQWDKWIVGDHVDFTVCEYEDDE